MTHVNIENLSLEFPIYSHSDRSFKNSIIRNTIGGVIRNEENSVLSIKALDNVCLTLQSGDKFGIVGHNGSGKTTLLRVIAGIYRSYSGTLKVSGSISSLLNISLGMDSEATGYENIRMRGIMMGLNLKKISMLEDEIAEFSELGDYLSLPIRTYSAGMHMRLGFSISTAIKPQILIMDEWLSVGDENFKAKAELRLKSLVNEDCILIIASQSRSFINSICNKSIELKHGRII